MNTEILVIFKHNNGLYFDKCYNYKNKTIHFYRNLAIEKGFGGGVDIIEFIK